MSWPQLTQLTSLVCSRGGTNRDNLGRVFGKDALIRASRFARCGLALFFPIFKSQKIDHAAILRMGSCRK